MSRTATLLSKAIVMVACIFGLNSSAQAQFAVTTNSGSGLAATYTSLANAITALNAATITSPVVITCPTGTETAPTGGYSITAQGTSVNTITIQGNGAANSVITAANPAGTSGTLTDAIFKLIGADYVTLQGFTMQENALNATTTSVSNNMTEWGVALLYAGTAATANGAKNNTIQNNTITLNRSYANSFGIYSSTRHTATSVSGAAEAASAAGAHTDNKVYGNSISNVNLGICLIGANADAVMDTGFDIGGSASGTGNTFSNWGNTVVAGSFLNVSGTVFCAYLFNQKSINFSYNTLTSASLNSANATRGIFLNYGSAPTSGSFTNTISNNTVTLTTTAAPTFEMIRHAGMSTVLSGVTINLNNNTLLNCSSGGEFVGIVNNNSAPGTLNISGNIIRGTAQSGTTAPFTGIQNTGAAVNQINITNNQIGNASGGAVAFSSANSSAVTGITNTGGASTCALTMTGNDLRGFVHSVAGSSAHTYLNNTATTLSQNISNNTFTNLNVNTTGNVTFISNSVSAPAAGVKTINGNSIVTAFNKAGAGGTVALYTDGGSSTSTTAHQNNNNNFSNISVTGATTITGWFNNDGTGGTPTKTITGNTFSNWTCGSSAVNVLQSNFGNPGSIANNTISGVTGTGAITGLFIGSSGTISALNISTNNIGGLSSTGAGGAVIGISNTVAATTVTISTNGVNTLSSSSGAVTGIVSSAGGTVSITGNTVHTLSSTGAATSNVISVTGGTTVTVSANKIYNCEANNSNASISGILSGGGTTVNLQNNLIGDLRTPSSVSPNSLIGMNITGGTNVNVRFNTVYLNGTSTGVNWGSSAIHAATTSTVTLNNNILVNTSTPSGGNLTVAYRRATTTLTTYGAGSNNNLFYAGTPGAQRLIFHDSNTGDQTLAAFKTRVSTRDAASVTENPPFLSTVGSNANFLHIDPATATAIESGGLTVSGITTDFDGDTRNVSTPDIGADEGTFTPLAGCSGTPAAGTSSVTGGSNACVGGTKALANTGATADLGITYQWQVSTTSGSGYANVSGGTGANSTNYTTGTLSVGTYYYVLRVTCTNGGLSTLSNEVTITVNPLPTVLVNGVSAATGTYCSPGGTPVSLAASGASTYAWSPAGGLSASTGANVTASPSTTTTYTVTGTDANGCTGTATAAITVAQAPIGVTASASPATICSGSTSVLVATGNVPTPASAYTLTPTSGTFTPLSGGTTVSTVKADDAISGALPIGFSFNFAGGSYTNVYASSNGFLSFNASATSTATNNLTSPSTTLLPLVAPLWDDLDGTSAGTASYLTTGTSPNRVFTFEWLNWEWNYQANAAVISFQVKLYESNGQVEFIYRQDAAAYNAGTTGGGSIGLAGTTSGNYLSLTNTTAAPGTSTTSETSNLTTKPATGQVYAFLPTQVSYSWSPALFVANPTSQATATTALAGPQTYMVTVSNGACSTTANATVSVSSTITGAAVTPAAPAFCAGSSVLLTAVPTGGSDHTYQWTGPSGPAGTGVTQSANAPGTWSVDITSCGVTQTASVTVVENPLPTPTITPEGPIDFCVSGTLTSSSATGNVWSSGGATTQAITVSTPGAYSVTVTDGNGCVGTSPSVTVSISVQPGAVSISPATPAAFCEGGSVALTASGGTYPAFPFNTVTSGNGGTTTVGNTTASTLGPDPLQNYYGGAKQQMVWLASELTALGLVSGTQITSMAIELLTADNTYILNNFRIKYQWSSTVSALTTTPLSTGWSVLFPSSSVTPQTGFNTFNFNAPITWNGTDNLLIEINYSNNNAGTTGSTYNTATYDLGLAYTASTFYRVDNNAASALNGYAMTMTNAYQGRNKVRFGVSAPTVQAPFTWSPGTGLNTTSGPTVTAGPSAPGQTYTVTATNGACTSAANVSVVVNPLPTVACPANSSVCLNATTFALTGGSPAGGTYSGPGVSAGNFDPAVAGAGTHTINYDYSDGNSCSNSCQFTITVNPLPVVSCGSYGPVCADAADIALVGSPAGGAWSGTGVTGNSFDPSAGTQTVTYSYTDGNGCSASCSTIITVNPLPVVNCGGPYAPQCDNGSPLALNGSPSGGTWSGNGVDGDAFDPSLAGVGSWTLTYTYSDGNGCTNSCETTIDVSGATPWYTDADNDGHGDIDDPGVFACEQPVGYVSSNDDECDNDPLKVETGTCGCGVAETDTDSDTFADCIDGCPTDPLKQNPGACGCGVADADSDGDGYMDCMDGCPNDPNKTGPGACGCGSPDVDSDGDTVLDCNDGCPNDASKLAPGTCGCGNPEPGAACDDNNANTVNDAITAGCVCAGTSTTPIYSLDITTDANGTQTSWEIAPLGGGEALCSGSGYPSNTTSTAFCPLPDAGCYVLTVYDALADGMCCVSGNGGYVLRAPGGQRIIDAANSGIFTSSASVALGFCTPIGTDRLTDSRCDRVDYLPSDFVQAIPNAAVQAQYGTGNQTDDGYQFWFFNPNGGYSRRITVTHANSNTVFPVGPDRCSYLRLNSIVTSPLPLNTFLNVRVRRQVNGVYAEFGPACRFKIDTELNCPTTQLVATPGPTFSCGITGVLLNGSRTIYAVPVSAANRYQFEFSKPGYLRKITMNTASLLMTVWYTMPLQYNSTYNVRVRVSYDAGATFCPFGPVCTIATAATPPAMGVGSAREEVEVGSGTRDLTMWPNPNNEGRVRFSMHGLGEGAHSVSVDIFDIMGARVQSEQLNIDGEELNTVLDLSSSIVPGVYLVNLTMDGHVNTERLVVQ